MWFREICFPFARKIINKFLPEGFYYSCLTNVFLFVFLPPENKSEVDTVSDMIFYDKEYLYHETTVRVTYRDTDRMGYSYYGNYPTYFEIGRTEFLRELGLTYKQLEDDGYLLPISKMTIQYHKPALYDELLTVRTIYKKLHSVKVEFLHEIYNEKKELINTAGILLVFVSAETRRPVQAPEYYMKLLENEWKKLKPKV